jgi:hypothetical protein
MGKKALVLFIPFRWVMQLRSSYGGSFKHLVMVRQTEDHIISSDDKKFTQPGNYMEAAAPEMLTLKMVHGTRAGL